MRRMKTRRKRASRTVEKGKRGAKKDRKRELEVCASSLFFLSLSLLPFDRSRWKLASRSTQEEEEGQEEACLLQVPRARSS